MRLKSAACVAVTCLLLLPGLSNAKGCLEGAAIGGVGGHVAGHHSLIGAAAGCAIGHHMANKKRVNAAPAPAVSPSPTTSPSPSTPVKP